MSLYQASRRGGAIIRGCHDRMLARRHPDDDAMTWHGCVPCRMTGVRDAASLAS